jgi:hypothetical protein
MNPTRRRLSGLLLIAPLAACGGGDDDFWDEFRPRPATPEDLQNRAFVFTAFRYGAVFHPSWSSTTATLSFGAASASVSPASLSFMLSTSSGSSAGSAWLEGDRLTLTIATPAPQHPFDRDEQLAFYVSADVDDGRIRLVNQASGEEQTSAPA